MPLWSKLAAGLALAAILIGFAGFKAYSRKLGPLVQEHGTTYYNGEGPVSAPMQNTTISPAPISRRLRAAPERSKGYRR